MIRNFSVEKQLKNNECEGFNSNNSLEIIYAGGLHYNRWKVLVEIANAIKAINNATGGKCNLRIYSSQNISSSIIEKLNLTGASEFCGSAPASQIADIYAKSDVLLHVESFDKRSIASTKYSFSTKIPEYMSAGKCILAVGPSQVASMKYLSKFACVAFDNVSISDKLKEIIGNAEYREKVGRECEKRYDREFSREEQEKCLNRIVSTC